MLHERYPRLKRILEHRRDDLTVLIDRVEKTHNVSAIARTADAVGCTRLHGVSDLKHIRIGARAAMGTGKGVRVQSHRSAGDACNFLRKQGFQLVAAHFGDRAVDYREPDYTQPTCFVMGQEKHGLDQTTADECDVIVTVPMLGLAGSLNVSVAAALLLYEAYRQREATGLVGVTTLPEAQRTRTLFRWCHPDIAKHLDTKGLSYPELDENGDIADPNFLR